MILKCLNLYHVLVALTCILKSINCSSSCYRVTHAFQICVQRNKHGLQRRTCFGCTTTPWKVTTPVTTTIQRKRTVSVGTTSVSQDIQKDDSNVNTVISNATTTVVQVNDSSYPKTMELLSKLDNTLRYFNTSTAGDLLVEIRKNNDNSTFVNEFLNNLLQCGPDRSLPFWTRFRPLARFSKRARLASLRRTLDLTTPPPSGEMDDNDDADDSENKPRTSLISSQATSTTDTTADVKRDVSLPLDEDRQRRRRRAFVSLLRTLSVPPEDERDTKLPSIVAIEKKAAQSTRYKAFGKNTNTMDNDLTNRKPTGLETPKYEVLVRRHAGSGAVYEIRQYQPFSVCTVSTTAPRPADSNRTDAKLSEPKTASGNVGAFGALAGYLFGKNEAQTAMKMTTPVLTTGRGSERVMSFVLPSQYWTETSLPLAPKPLAGSGVELRQTPSEVRAVVMFGGYASKQEVQRNKRKLRMELAKDNDWEEATIATSSTTRTIDDDGTNNDASSITLAQYNDPFTPPWKRLNEVSVAVVQRQR